MGAYALQRQSTICGMVQNTIENGRNPARRLASTQPGEDIAEPSRRLQTREFGLGTSTMQAQRYGYTQMVNNAILTNSSYKMRFRAGITL